jgi:hypothetical protein
MENKVNLADKLALLDEPYSPGIVGYLNDYGGSSPPRSRASDLRDG